MAFAGIFPGQGSQSIGMLSALAESSTTVSSTFAEASDALGFDLWKMVVDGDEATLNQTINTQPSMLAAGIAVWRVWQEQGGVMPSAVAGHSLGEYSALVAAGKLDFADAIKLVRARAEAMQQAVPEGVGAMAAILGLEDAQILSVCEQAAGDEVVEAVNFNSPGQVVIAGNAGAIDRAIELATEAGAKRAIKLAVSVPSHCALMKPAAEQLAEKLSDITFTATDMPVIHNVSATQSASVEEVPSLLAEQLFKPVRWVESITDLKNSHDAQAMLEFGPGKVLMGLNRRIDRSIKTICVHDPASMQKGLELCEEMS
ncbi:MAG: Malonyl CoA-acyl carrier protein transacylase (EC [uncultured Thiotrichaceae bacterium]|uniref:Malonyl CoA-acyl carrier protein transacylase n=1 Tax=uncultured Thiotrichaceae bacterium TaxID=298394 RepID=A0A6S6T2R1_9GAMM|nr:MAG: Malonyl CoA-acyl carrier protein transacylase (EC [uncultured Thiotrichaceae bacterium]